MLQELFRIPGLDLPVYGYGVMLVIGFFAGLALAKFLARRSGLDPEVFVNAALIALVTGVIGARLSHVLENLREFTRPELGVAGNLANVFNMRSGGLTYYGGFLLAFPCTVLYGVHKKVPIRTGMDIIAPCVMIGLGFGRIGCFLNGCCHGAECNLPWAVTFPYHSNAMLDHFEDREHPLELPPELTYTDPLTGRVGVRSPDSLKRLGPQFVEISNRYRSRPVHPAQLYSTFTAWMLAALLVAYFTLPHVPGRVFALMLMLEGAARFVLESLRTEPPVLGPLSLSMVIGILLVIGGALMWVLFGQYPVEKTPGSSRGLDVVERGGEPGKPIAA
jgi:phosphatidylglycerol:prolipoprotein diacylglycerol transferase